MDKVHGVSKAAWNKVSDQNPGVLHPTILEVTEEGKFVDQIKERLARNMFSEKVEQKMEENGDITEANFCKVFREGLYNADDSPGIPATERCQKRVNLIKWLEEGVDFGDFPPYGATIKGLSHILYEGLRSSSEAKLYLYTLAKSAEYIVFKKFVLKYARDGPMRPRSPYIKGGRKTRV